MNDILSFVAFARSVKRDTGLVGDIFYATKLVVRVDETKSE